MEYINNQFIIQFVSDHWVVIILIYGILKAFFPNSQLLARLAEKISGVFPILKKKEWPNK